MDFDRIDFDRVGNSVIGVYIDALSWNQTLAKISSWAAARKSRYVCLCNVHSLVTANEDATFRLAVIQSDMAMPDGMPVVWMLRRMGYAGQERINGPDLMWKYCALAEKNAQPVFFYGSTDGVLTQLKNRLREAFPNLRIAGSIAPPFHSLTAAENEGIINEINKSGAGVVFVGLGCPKQELWMAEHSSRINAVLVGVGAAFDYHAGTLKRAPYWMQSAGLEWCYRLFREPGRLWKRYLKTNTLFILKATHQLFGMRSG